MLQIIKNITGVSIVEVMVCLSLIATSLLGVVSLVTQNIQVQYINRNNLIASNLAQECQEMVRNRRDINWNESSPQIYYQGIADPGGLTKKYVLPIDGTDLAEVTDFNDQKTNLYLCDGGTYDKFYIHNINGNDCAGGGAIGPLTIFKRIVSTIQDGSASSTSIACTVRWDERGRTHDYTTSGILYDWVFRSF